MLILPIFIICIIFLLQNKGDKSNTGKSGKKKTKSSKDKAAIKSKLASKIISSKTADPKLAKENDQGRNTNAVITDTSNVFVDTIRDTILKDLKETDFVMETPSAAIFTLVVGRCTKFTINKKYIIYLYIMVGTRSIINIL